MRTAKTYFEQVPLNVVKKIAQRDDPTGKASSLAIVQSSMGKTEMTDLDNSRGLQYPAWQKLCQEALMELDKDKLGHRVSAAEAAVVERLQELVHGQDAQAERQALLDATSSLRFLKRDALKFPDWESGRKA